MTIPNIVTCDDVFDTLTRGPFPSGCGNDDLIETHLGNCPECRVLAEAFRPATELLHEALCEDERLELPTYHGRLSSDAKRDVNENGDAAWMLKSIRHRATLTGSRDHASRRGDRAAPAFFAVVALLLVAFVWRTDSGNSSSATDDIGPISMGSSHGFSGQEPRDARRLASLNLLDSCFTDASATIRVASSPPSTTAPLADIRTVVATSVADAVRYECCTRCHSWSAASGGMTSRGLTIVVSSCTACHSTAGTAGS